MGTDEPITLVPYDPMWPTYFDQEKNSILNVLSEAVREIEHFGSTAIPGLISKPIVDILVGVQHLPMSDDQIHTLETLQYEYLGEAGVPGRFYFRKRRNLSFNIAVVEWNGHLWNDNLLLRDFLLSHPKHAEKYAESKKAIVADGTVTLLDYSHKKDAIIAAMLREARILEK